MGIKRKSDADAETRLQLWCNNCDRHFWTDHTVANECPHCGSNWDWDVAE